MVFKIKLSDAFPSALYYQLNGWAVRFALESEAFTVDLHLIINNVLLAVL